jgi:centromere protein J
MEEIKSQDGKVQRFYDNGKKEVIFSNGVKREVWPSGYSVVYFANNDVK